MDGRRAGIAVVLVAGVAGLVAFLINSGGAGSGAEGAPARAVVVPSPSAEAPGPPQPPPSKRLVVERAPAPAPAPPGGAAAKAQAISLPPGTLLKTGLKDTPWELIAPGSIGDTVGPENGMALERGMKATYPKFRACAANYRPPESMKSNGWWEGNVVLDVESSADGYEIVDATVDMADFADDSLESCLRARYKGVQVKVPGLEPGKRYRINYPVGFAFGTKEKMDAP
jgi:hypothetical protein